MSANGDPGFRDRDGRRAALFDSVPRFILEWWKMARPTGFEPVTSAFGGQFPPFYTARFTFADSSNNPIFIGFSLTTVALV